MIGTILAAAGTGLSIFEQLKAADNAKIAAAVTSGTILQTSELNAQLIEQGSELNAGVHDFNAAALEGQATDAIARGKQTEGLFRKQLRGVIGSQRASFAAQGVEVSSGSAEQVQEDTAYQGELDALQIRTNAAREAWGFQVEATGERLQATNTRKLGTLQAANTRAVGRANANNARITGQNQASAAQWGAASTLVAGGYSIAKSYGFGT
jgi:hypothetical protein